MKLEIEIKSNIPVNIEDIDKEDHRNPFLVAAYAKDIYDYLKYLEVFFNNVLFRHLYIIKVYFNYKIYFLFLENTSN